MLIINCPFCGPRNESEFINGGPSKIDRPDNPDAVSDADWIDYLIVPRNPIGFVDEEWWHVRGCTQWFSVRRHTATHEIVYDGSRDSVS